MKIKLIFEKFAPSLFILILVLVAFIGFSWKEIAKLESIFSKKENEQTVTGVAGPRLGRDDLKGYAKELGLDSDKFNSCFDGQKYKDELDMDVAYGYELELEGTPAFFVGGHYIDGVVTFSILREAIEFELKGGDWSKMPANLTDYVSSDKEDINIERGEKKGREDAKVVLVEFGDFECSYCGQFWSESEGQLIKDYVDTGKVLFVFKQLPLFTVHPNAVNAAHAAYCASEQGKFWEMHDLMYKSHGY